MLAKALQITTSLTSKLRELLLQRGETLSRREIPYAVGTTKVGRSRFAFTAASFFQPNATYRQNQARNQGGGKPDNCPLPKFSKTCLVVRYNNKLQSFCASLASARFRGFSGKITPKRTWLCAGISPVRYALQTR